VNFLDDLPIPLRSLTLFRRHNSIGNGEAVTRKHKFPFTSVGARGSVLFPPLLHTNAVQTERGRRPHSQLMSPSAVVLAAAAAASSPRCDSVAVVSQVTPSARHCILKPYTVAVAEVLASIIIKPSCITPPDSPRMLESSTPSPEAAPESFSRRSSALLASCDDATVLPFLPGELLPPFLSHPWLVPLLAQAIHPHLRRRKGFAETFKRLTSRMPGILSGVDVDDWPFLSYSPHSVPAGPAVSHIGADLPTDGLQPEASVFVALVLDLLAASCDTSVSGLGDERHELFLAAVTIFCSFQCHCPRLRAAGAKLLGAKLTPQVGNAISLAWGDAHDPTSSRTGRDLLNASQ
jgi:hypothetical protein